MMYAQVVFPIASFTSFTYKIPRKIESNIYVGCSVNAPFRNKNIIGYIISIHSATPFKGKTHYIDSIYKGKAYISPDLWKVIIWMSKYYVSPIGLCVKAALSSNILKEQNSHKSLYIEINYDHYNRFTGNLSKNQKKLIDILLRSTQPVLASSYKSKISNLYYVIESLVKKHILSKIYFDKQDMCHTDSAKVPFTLSSSQNNIFNQIVPYIQSQQYHNFLLHGVPGSGKTEIYIKLALETIAQNQSVIILIPEIILSTQMQDRLKNYFGDTIAIWHSKMTNKDKQYTLKKISSGEYKIIVGARSCIFTPISNLGLIVVDEEQDSSYKQDSPKPYYNARDVAIMRASYADCPIVLTSATPSLESYYNTLINKSSLLTLKEKYYQSTTPKIEIINMLDQNNKDVILSDILLNAIKETLLQNKQCILLNNRRGYATSIFSNNDKEPLLCINCSVPMSFHKISNMLLCHYCNSQHSYNEFSKDHMNNDVLLNGYGTEKIYEVINQEFKNANVIRVDSDSLSSKTKLETLLRNFSNGSIDIMVGTQMISKGLDFNDVELVGVINADYGMFTPDFRSGERVFQIISQVIGRAGRREIRGKAIIQTYNPDNLNLINAMKSDHKSFYARNLAERNELQYPPFTRLCRLTFIGNNMDQVLKIATIITDKLSRSKSFKVLGPAEAPIAKIKKMWRVNTLIIAPKEDPMVIQEKFISIIGIHVLEKKYNHVKIKLDIDPVNML